MNTNIAIGRYIPVDSPLHGMDPRIKILFTIASIIVLFSISNTAVLVAMYLFLTVLVAVSRLGIVYIFKSIKSIWMLLFLAFAFQIFGQNGRVVVDLGFLTITETSLYNALVNVSRLVFLIIISTIFTGTTSPIRIADAVESILNSFRVPKSFSHELSLVLTIAIRFIPVISDEAKNIIDSQKSRGASLDSGRFIERIKSLFPILIPLLINTVRRADDLALAMDVRCYSGYQGRTKFKKMRMKKTDFVYMIILFGILTVFLVIDKLWI